MSASPWKVPLLFATLLFIGWVIADAVGVRLPTDPAVPTMDSLLAHASDVESMKSKLRSTAVHDEDAAHLIAICLLHENPNLRQAARSVAHDRLDHWQLASPEDQQKMVSWLSGSLRRLLEANGPTAMLHSETKEINDRINRMALRPSFGDAESCLNDCAFVSSVGVQQNEIVPPRSQPINDRLRQSIIAPVTHTE